VIAGDDQVLRGGGGVTGPLEVQGDDPGKLAAAISQIRWRAGSVSVAKPATKVPDATTLEGPDAARAPPSAPSPSSAAGQQGCPRRPPNLPDGS